MVIMKEEDEDDVNRRERLWKEGFGEIRERGWG